MRTYRDLFSVAEFRVLFVSTSLTVASASVGSLALATLTYAETGSPVLSAFAMFGGPLVRLACSWFMLSLADLWRPRTSIALVAGVDAVAFGLQALPDLALVGRFVLLLVPWIVLSGLGGSTMALVADILPEGTFVFGRATLNIAVGVMQVVGYGAGGLLLLTFTTSELFLGAAVAALFVLVIVRVGLANRPPRATGKTITRSRAANRVLLGSPVLRPVYLALWVPNGLVVGCEALIVPYAGERAGFLFAASAVGMLAGDIGMGRFVPPAWRDRMLEPARLLLALPWLLFALQPELVMACALSATASIGYCASLPLQERLVTRTAPNIRGHALGLNGLGMMAMQGVGALLAGAAATALGSNARAAGLAMSLMAAASVLVTLALIPGLRHSRADRPVEVATLPQTATIQQAQ